MAQKEFNAMKYPRLFAAVAAAALTSGCATSIGGVDVQARLPGDVFEQVRGAVAPRDIGPFTARYTLSAIENENQSGYNGCGARATFIDQRAGSYVHLRPRQIEELLETGQTRYRWKTVRYEEFGRSLNDAQHALESAYQGVSRLAARNSRSGLCFGYN